jgi:hypothetical protein
VLLRQRHVGKIWQKAAASIHLDESRKYGKSRNFFSILAKSMICFLAYSRVFQWVSSHFASDPGFIEGNQITFTEILKGGLAQDLGFPVNPRS